MRALLIVALLASAARADESFEAKAQGAQRVHSLGDLAWALTATCETGEDVQQRQCRHLREARLKELASATFLVEAKASSFEVGAWSPQKKSIPLTLSACIDCEGFTVNGKTLFATGAAPTVDGGRVKGARLLDTTRQFNDEGAAKAWLTAAKTARVQLLVKVPEKARWSISGKDGLALDIVGYRVYSPCEGTVFAASPSSGPVEPDKKACAKK
jgi:hypothetical protein